MGAQDGVGDERNVASSSCHAPSCWDGHVLLCFLRRGKLVTDSIQCLELLATRDEFQVYQASSS